MKRSFQEHYHHGKGDLVTYPNTFTVKHQFDRIEYSNDNAYRVYRGTEPLGKNIYNGFCKCKLIHSKDFSIIVPDLIYIKTDDLSFKWFQFYSFLPSLIDKDNLLTQTVIDISGGHTIIISFTPDSHIKNLSDDSNLFECKIQGPSNIMQYATGTGKIIEDEPYITLYHHTTPEIKEKILNTQILWGSVWNIQGNKKLKNILYSYFTCLDEIKKNCDFKMIAMAMNEKIRVILDGTLALEGFYIKVYRGKTEDRTASIPFLINANIVGSRHVMQRRYDDPKNFDYFYEISNPYIFRVGIKPNSVIKFKDQIINTSKENILPNYIILSNLYSKEAAIAQFDEENTNMIGKIQPFTNNNSNLIDHLMNNPDKDFYNSIEPAVRELRSEEIKRKPIKKVIKLYLEFFRKFKNELNIKNF